MLAAFDVVGFDPRGVGTSTPLECVGDEKLDELISSDPDPDTPAETRYSDYLIKDLGNGCLRESGDLTRHMSTVEVAKDVDILRAALGDTKLSYFGASYGTFIGATYAGLFPGRVGRMVLDGALDPSLSTLEKNLVQAEGFEVALRAYVGACVDRGGCFLGDSVDASTRRIREFLDEVEKNPLPGVGARELESGNAVLGIWLPLYNKDYWPILDQALKSAFAGRGAQLLRLADAYVSRGPTGYQNNGSEAIYAVNCLDQRRRHAELRGPEVRRPVREGLADLRRRVRLRTFDVRQLARAQREQPARRSARRVPRRSWWSAPPGTPPPRSPGRRRSPTSSTPACWSSGTATGTRATTRGTRAWTRPSSPTSCRARSRRPRWTADMTRYGAQYGPDITFLGVDDDCDGVFLSVDVDVCDPGHAPGTGTPGPGGLTARELLDSVRRICLELPVVGMDIVEVSPPNDHAEITAFLANRVALEALSGIAARKKGLSHDPAGPLLEGR